jgi:5,10-methylenetetrahydrofolate reductase
MGGADMTHLNCSDKDAKIIIERIRNAAEAGDPESLCKALNEGIAHITLTEGEPYEGTLAMELEDHKMDLWQLLKTYPQIDQPDKWFKIGSGPPPRLDHERDRGEREEKE